MDHNRAPVLEAIAAFRDEHSATYSLPGHRLGGGVDEETARVLGRAAFADDVESAKQAVPEAEALYAYAVGARQVVFTTCGSTISVHTAVMTVAGPGQTVLVDRNVHKSVLAGLIFAGARPVWLRPQWDHEGQMAHPATAEDVGRRLDEVPAILPGERFTEPVVHYLRAGKAAGMTIPDASDPSLETFRVVA